MQEVSKPPLYARITFSFDSDISHSFDRFKQKLDNEKSREREETASDTMF